MGGGGEICKPSNNVYSLFYDVVHYDVTIANPFVYGNVERVISLLSQKKKAIFVEKIQNGKYNLLYLYFFHVMLFVYCPFQVVYLTKDLNTLK